MNQPTIPGDEVVFRLPANLGRNAQRVAFALAFVVPLLGGVSLMGVADAPMLNAMGLVMALLSVMAWATWMLLHKGGIR